jgi:peptidyl-prolyl cis-trans isomerase D
VLDRRAFTDKYTAAVIKKVIDFSKDTRAAAYNKFSEFVTKCTNVEAMQQNAKKYGYKVQELSNISTAEHYVAGVHATREALKWIFSANQGDISPLYECGDNDHMMVLALTNIHPQGYREYTDAQVKEFLQREVIKDKKAEKLIAKLQGVNSLNAAKAKGGKIVAVNQVTFAAPAFIQETGAMEPALSGAVAGTAAGKFSKAPVKGNAGVYVFQVQKKTKRAGAKFDVAAQMQNCRQRAMQQVGNFMQDLITKAGVVDNRYIFF